MGVENKTANQLAERRNNFLRELSALGRDIIMRTKVQVGGTFDPISETMSGASTVDLDNTYVKSALSVAIRQLNDAQSATGMSVVAGHKLEGLEADTSLFLRLHSRVPLNLQAIYIVDGVTYRIKKVLANVHLGSLLCWNEVLLEKA